MNLKISSIILGRGTFKPAKSFEKKAVWLCRIRANYTQKTFLGTMGGHIKTPGEAHHKFLFVALAKGLFLYLKWKRSEYAKVRAGDNSFFTEQFIRPEMEQIKP